MCVCAFFFQAEDGIRDLVRSRGLGDVYKRQVSTGGFRALLDEPIRFGSTLSMNIAIGDFEISDILSLIHI